MRIRLSSAGGKKEKRARGEGGGGIGYGGRGSKIQELEECV